MPNGITVINIREYLSSDAHSKLGEVELSKLLSEYSCIKNPDVENFLKTIPSNLQMRKNSPYVMSGLLTLHYIRGVFNSRETPLLRFFPFSYLSPVFFDLYILTFSFVVVLRRTAV